ncbi:hypothetical protein Tco_1010215 [Tanacetum coccineum]
MSVESRLMVGVWPACIHGMVAANGAKTIQKGNVGEPFRRRRMAGHDTSAGTRTGNAFANTENLVEERI